MQAYFRTLAAYNAWANARLYDAVAQVSAADFRADRGAFFGSLCGTLNHLLVGDRIWMKRITGEGDAPDRLDVILHDDFAGLRTARESEDRRIIAMVDGLDAARLSGTLAFRNMRGQDMAQPMTAVLAHVFNHQTHHRGQAHTLLSQIGLAPPQLDLLYFLPDWRA